jgi:hypothetical protein
MCAKLVSIVMASRHSPSCRVLWVCICPLFCHFSAPYRSTADVPASWPRLSMMGGAIPRIRQPALPAPDATQRGLGRSHARPALPRDLPDIIPLLIANSAHFQMLRSPSLRWPTISRTIPHIIPTHGLSIAILVVQVVQLRRLRRLLIRLSRWRQRKSM